MDNKNQYILSSLYNALEILDLLSKYEELSLAEISKEVNLGKASVFRMLYTLEKKGFVHKTSHAKYKLGMKFAYYGSIASERQNILSVARPHLQKLRDKLNETVHMSILDNDNNVIFMLKEVGNYSIQMASKVGAKMPPYCTGTGKMLLAGLPDEELKNIINNLDFGKKTNYTITDRIRFEEEIKKIRILGYAEDIEECEIGLICYAAPVKDMTGNIIAAISVSGPTERMRQNRLQLIDAIKEEAKDISEAMGYIENRKE